jgi:outer membrane protein OmpA-like peptidoglycan-associated protein
MDMLKWHRRTALGLALGALALPAIAQQRDAADKDGDQPAAAPEAKGFSAVDLRRMHNAFAMPAFPRQEAKKSAATQSSDDAPGRLVPKWELAGMYQYINFNPGSPFANFNNQGGAGSFTYNPSPWLGLTAELGGYHYQRNLFPLTGSNAGVSGGITSYLFGPRLNLRKFDHFVPFGEFLIGGTHGGVQLTGDQGQSAFALLAGGGIDVVLNKYVAWRFAELDYMMTNHSGSALGGNGRQDNFRAGTGIVLRFGFPNATPPPPANRSPVAACSANPTSVFAGSNDVVTVHVDASDPDNDPLTYSYSATSGTVSGTGPDARWNSSGLNPGTYTVNVKVDDGKGGTASCAVDIKVEEKPHHPPTATLSVERNPIMPGERTGVTCTGNSPDNEPLTYSYTTTGGQIEGSGDHVQFDATGVQPGSYSIKCTVTDPNRLSGDASGNVDVQQPPPPPQATKVGDCGYNKPGAARFDNACKRVGDDVALRLNNDPAAKLVIVGYADPKEPSGSKLSAARAEGARSYIVKEKGIDASRVSTRTAPGTAGATDNRRVDFVVVPEGATY